MVKGVESKALIGPREKTEQLNIREPQVEALGRRREKHPPRKRSAYPEGPARFY